MSLRIKHIRLRAHTTGGLYGTDVSLDGGLTVLHAPNTSGKSTVLHALLYALGLEQMLSPRREIPLSYAMREYIEDPYTSQRHKILESYVSVEIQNSSGEHITVRRNVVSQIDKRLINVVEGPELSQGPGDYTHQDYFVSDPGAAQRKSGFHHRLAEFMGWELPVVKRYDGRDCPLYVETIFPLFFVEQKVGWTTLPGAIPTQFRIREVQRRSVEFLMDFETHDMELRRQDLELRINSARTEWAKTRDGIGAMAMATGLRVARLPTSPTMFENDVRSSFLEVAEGGEWRPLAERMAELLEEMRTLDEQPIPEVQSVVRGAVDEVEKLTAEIHTKNSERAEIFRARQSEMVQQASISQRIEQLGDDLQKNKDVLKLRKFGSTLSRELVPNHCPTCDQPIDDALLPQRTLNAVMSIEENIEYIGAQMKAFKRLADRSAAIIREFDLELRASGEDVRRLSSRLRALKSDLIAPSHYASASFIENRLRIEQRLNQLREAQAHFDEQLNRLVEQAFSWSELLSEKQGLPDARLSESDITKVRALQGSIRAQLARYGFITFPPKDLTVSEDTYRPEKEGFEIGFELSASDSIRLKWAYQLGLLDVAQSSPTNHPGLVVFDEPRQQEAAEMSVAGLLSEAARIAASGVQILIATSEELSTVRNFVANVDRQLIIFKNRMIERIDTVD